MGPILSSSSSSPAYLQPQLILQLASIPPASAHPPSAPPLNPSHLKPRFPTNGLHWGTGNSLRSHRGHLRKPTKIERLLEIEEVDENEVNCKIEEVDEIEEHYKIEDEDKIEEEVIGEQGLAALAFGTFEDEYNI
jgi:hypothetical protein